MEQLQTLFSDMAWWFNGTAVVLMLLTRICAHNKGTWALVGVILLIISLGNSTLLVLFGNDTSSQLATLFSTVVHASLGATLVANWLTDGAA